VHCHQWLQQQTWAGVVDHAADDAAAADAAAWAEPDDLKGE